MTYYSGKPLWKYHPTERDLLAKFVSEGNDAAVNRIIREIGGISVFAYMNRYARTREPWCWILFGKEVRHIPEPEQKFDSWERESWWIDGKEIESKDFWWRLRDWMKVQALEAGIVVDL